MSFQSTVVVFDSHLPFQKPSEFEGGEVDVPYAVVDFFETDILAGADNGDFDPFASPADAAIVTAVAALESLRVLQSRKAVGRRVLPARVLQCLRLAYHSSPLEPMIGS
jgi:hypothetical protein